MITINIIPKELKDEIRVRKLYTDIKRAVILASIFLIFYTASLVSGKMLLESHYSDISSRASIISKDTQKFTNSADEINKELAEIEKIQGNNVYWSDLVMSLGSGAGEGIEIIHLSVSNRKDFVLRGRSDSREALLASKDELGKNSFLSDINLPLKNLLEKSDIEFELTAKISSYEFSETKKD